MWRHRLKIVTSTSRKSWSAYDEDFEGDPGERLPLVSGVVLTDPDLRSIKRIGENSVVEDGDGERADVLPQKPVWLVADAQEGDELVHQHIATDHRLFWNWQKRFEFTVYQ